jgi:hypothetical protein
MSNIKELQEWFNANQAMIKLGYKSPKDLSPDDLDKLFILLDHHMGRIENIFDECFAKCEADLQLQKIKDSL